MDMTRDALQYVVGLKTAEVLDINGGSMSIRTYIEWTRNFVLLPFR